MIFKNWMLTISTPLQTTIDFSKTSSPCLFTNNWWLRGSWGAVPGLTSLTVDNSHASPSYLQKKIPSDQCCQLTVWKFHDFSSIHISREIKVVDSWGPKTAILTLLEALNFDFHEFLHFLKAEVYPNLSFRGT